MSKSEKANITASILQRLKNYSQTRQEDRGLTITDYAIERFFYRLSISQYSHQFVLIPSGFRVRQIPPTQQYPNGYWRLEKPMSNGGWLGIDPSTMKPGTQPQTHIPLPE